MLLNNRSDASSVDLTRGSVLTEPATASLNTQVRASYIGPRHKEVSKETSRLNMLVDRLKRSVAEELSKANLFTSTSSFEDDFSKLFKSKYFDIDDASTYLNPELPHTEVVYLDWIVQDEDFYASTYMYEIFYKDSYDEIYSYMPLLNTLEVYTERDLNMDHMLLYDLETDVITLNPYN